MSISPAKRLFFITGRLLLVVSLVFSTGAWASLGTSLASANHCDHLMNDAGASAGLALHQGLQEHGDGAMACCKASGLDACLTGAVVCSAACEAVCAASWQAALASAPVLPTPPGRTRVVSPPAAGTLPPSLPRVLRPPISA